MKALSSHFKILGETTLTTSHLSYHFFESKKTVIPSKTLILYHGWGGTTTGYREFAEHLAVSGFNVVVPEIIFHDTRNPLDNHFDPQVTQCYFWKTIWQSIDEFHELTATLGVDLHDVVLIGSSMGGFIANGIFARESQLAGLVNVNGSGSFLFSERFFRNRNMREELSRREVQTFSTYDPIERPVGNAPILLMHGETDTIIPIQLQQHYYHRLMTEHQNNVEFLTYRDVNHQFTEEMINDLTVWLSRHFLSNE